MAGSQIRSYEENMGMASRRSVTHHDVVESRSSHLISELKKTPFSPSFLFLSLSIYLSIYLSVYIYLSIYLSLSHSHNLFSHKMPRPFAAMPVL